jgi:hypothetical protein
MPVRNHQFSTQMNPEWRSAHQKLLENVREKPFVSQYELSVFTSFDGQKIYLPAYIPYIGPQYFEYRPRILCYAINQNLSRHTRWTQDWVNSWATDIEAAQDRLNHAAKKGQALPIRPHAEGFIPLVALLAIRHWSKTHGGCLPHTIDNVAAVTNFVKFSTTTDASSSSIPNIWWRECGELYVTQEIRILKPDIILAFGQKTLSEVRRVLKSIGLSSYEPKLLGCRFPARIASIKSRPLSSRESKTWNTDILPLINKIHKPEKSYHKWRAQNFPGYFLEVISSWDHVT